MDTSESLRSQPCSCVSCMVCRGSGRVEVPSDGYPEWELETCDECDGTGIVQTCDRCLFLDELEHDEL